MVLFIPSLQHYLLMSMLLITSSRISDCYDPLDPSGNITVTFDIFKYTPDGYVARVTIQNYHQYRHVEKPGWRLGWTWVNEEVIRSMVGALATRQGDCKPSTDQKPHCCMLNPVVIDATPDASTDNRIDGCCRGGILSAWAIDPPMSRSSFEITVSNLDKNKTGYQAPVNLTLMAPGPGYTCSPIRDTSPSISSVLGGRREEQVFRTWTSACTYSSYLSSKTPVCCVSLSTFYNPSITPCPSCSCGCRVADQSANSCISKDAISSTIMVSISNSEGAISSNVGDAELMKCTDHMCPLRIHWHIKNNYVTHWKVKLTVSNYHYERSYSNWNVVVQHPGFRQSLAVSSFNTTMIPTHGAPDDTALFWGKAFHNTELLQANEYDVGSVTTDVLLQKDANSFTLSNGWAFPRRISFNGESCQMPLPDTFPMLPNTGTRSGRKGMFLLITLLLYLPCTMCVGCC